MPQDMQCTQSLGAGLSRGTRVPLRRSSGLHSTGRSQAAAWSVCGTEEEVRGWLA